VPASVGMLIENMTGQHLSDRELEEVCGFTPGQEVWEFQWMLHVAGLGLDVCSVEDFDPELFIRDPYTELLRQTQSKKVVDRIFEVSDVSAQVQLAQRCLAHPHVSFRRAIPSVSDLRDAIEGDAVALVNVNARVLNQREGYAGHVIFVHASTATGFVIEDPGPPPHEGAVVPDEQFIEAWTSPTPGMANFVRISLPSEKDALVPN
jgi:hypothetical protein